MPKFYNSDMAELAHQLTLSPRRLRVEQLRGVANLVSLIEPNRAYPFDFVCFHITKYQKRGKPAEVSIPGKALLNDLITTAEIVSRKANLTVAEVGEPCCTHADLARELQVSTKTVRRWRSRGLMGLRLNYEDGVNRLAFCRSTVDRFVDQNKDLVQRGASFKQLSADERRRIIERARQLAAQRPVKLHAAAKRIAAETGRAVETIRYTLRRFDQAHKETAIFGDRGRNVRCERQEAIWSRWQEGQAVESIAREFACKRTEIESTLRQVRLQRWCEPPIEWVHHELFDAPNADEIILDAPAPAVEGAAAPRIPSDLPPYLRSLYLTPLLSFPQEQDLFRRYNYLKFKAARLLKTIEPAGVTPRAFERIARLMKSVESIKQRIIQANLRLVVSIAKKHVGWSANFFEVISDGNVSLMRAVEKFDYSRGYKFSTYATWAIMKNYARSVPEQHYHYARYVTGQEEILEAAPDTRAGEVPASDRTQVRDLIEAGLNELTEREREIVSNHFGLADEDGGSMTLEQLGERFGVTKERVRQIEQRALSRLRQVLPPSLAETFIVE